MANKPVLHRRDHEHGGADPVRIVWESTGEAGTAAGFVPRVEELQSNSLASPHLLDATAGAAYIEWEDNVEWSYQTVTSQPLIFVDPGDPRVIAIPIEDSRAIYQITLSVYGLRETTVTDPSTRYVLLNGWTSHGSPGSWANFPGDFPSGFSIGSNSAYGVTSSDGLPCVPDSTGPSSNMCHWFSFYADLDASPASYASLTFEVRQQLQGDTGNYAGDAFSQVVLERIKQPTFDV